MGVWERYLRWVFGDSKYKYGIGASDYLLLPLYTPLALLQDKAIKNKKHHRL